MRYLSALLAAAILAVMAHSAVAGDMRLHVLPAATVKGRVVLLGDIARPDASMSQAEWGGLQGKKVFDMPEDSNRPLIVQKDKLREALVQALGQAMADACELPQDGIHVQIGGKCYPEADLRRLVVDYLTPFASRFGGEPEMRDIKVPSFFMVQNASDRLDIAPSGELAPGRINLKLMAKSAEGKVYRQASVSLFLDIWKNVPCAGRPLNAGETLTPEAVDWRRKNLGTIKGAVWDGKTGPFRIRRSVGMGQPITDDILEHPPVISKSDRVSLVYEGRNVQLEVPAQALSDGRAGASITVRNLQTNKEVLAVVKDSQTVVVR